VYFLGIKMINFIGRGIFSNSKMRNPLIVHIFLRGKLISNSGSGCFSFPFQYLKFVHKKRESQMNETLFSGGERGS